MKNQVLIYNSLSKWQNYKSEILNKMDPAISLHVMVQIAMINFIVRSQLSSNNIIWKNLIISMLSIVSVKD